MYIYIWTMVVTNPSPKSPNKCPEKTLKMNYSHLPSSKHNAPFAFLKLQSTHLQPSHVWTQKTLNLFSIFRISSTCTLRYQQTRAVVPTWNTHEYTLTENNFNQRPVHLKQWEVRKIQIRQISWKKWAFRFCFMTCFLDFFSPWNQNSTSEHMGVSLNGGTPKTPKIMIIFGRKTHGCWVPPF